jgi:ABC-type multidrug transport system ATPase subunit
MKITLTDVGKRFNREWIFRHLDFNFTNGNAYAIIGPNGSGKSTLLQVIAGAMSESEGKIRFETAGGGEPTGTEEPATHPHQDPATTRHSAIAAEDLYREISISAPYMELIDEMTLTEFLGFHQVFKPLIAGVDIPRIAAETNLEKSAHKQMRYYSSGMKQRVKLAQAFFSDTRVLLLDEPCTNLDEEGIGFYRHLIRNYTSDRLVIISSNDPQEYDFCEQRINIPDYKE